MSDPNNLGATQVGGEIEHAKLMKVAPHLGEDFVAKPLPPLPQSQIAEVVFSSHNDDNAHRSDTSFDADMGITPAEYEAQNWQQPVETSIYSDKEQDQDVKEPEPE